MPPKKPLPLDVHIGSRIRFKRKAYNVTQQKLAKELNITFQQVQKYESGTNRVSASRLFQIAQTLNVPIKYFFEEWDPPKTP